MTQADVSEIHMNCVSLRTRGVTVESNVPTRRLEDDADLREIYTFGRKLGQGSFGVVYEATHIETQTKWAIKEVCRPTPGSSKVRMLEQEINILKQVNHEHIIHLQEVYKTAKMTYLVTELCVGGELKQLLQRKKFFTEDETRHIICSLADAIFYLHKRVIVHRDLKLENILVKNSLEDDDSRINIKVTDFGLSVQTDVESEHILTEVCGTLMYMAPEMLRSGRGYTQWCDVWSTGVIMYMLLCGEAPFVSKTKANLLEEIKNKGVQFTQPIWANVSDAAKTVLTYLLKVDPAYRMSAGQLLENPWITGETNKPVIPSNVLLMMRDYVEQEEKAQTLEDLSLSCSDDRLVPDNITSATSTGTIRNGRSYTKLIPERDSKTSTKPTKESVSLQQDKHRNGSKTLGPLQHTTTLSHAGVKPQLTAQQPRPWDKTDVSTGQKPASDITKVGDQRPSTSGKSRTGPRKPPVCAKTSKPL